MLLSVIRFLFVTRSLEIESDSKIVANSREVLGLNRRKQNATIKKRFML